MYLSWFPHTRPHIYKTIQNISKILNAQNNAKMTFKIIQIIFKKWFIHLFLWISPNGECCGDRRHHKGPVPAVKVSRPRPTTPWWRKTSCCRSPWHTLDLVPCGQLAWPIGIQFLVIVNWLHLITPYIHFASMFLSLWFSISPNRILQL